jgi:hypothetical protein
LREANDKDCPPLDNGKPTSRWRAVMPVQQMKKKVANREIDYFSGHFQNQAIVHFTTCHSLDKMSQVQVKDYTFRSSKKKAELLSRRPRKESRRVLMPRNLHSLVSRPHVLIK